MNSILPTLTGEVLNEIIYVRKFIQCQDHCDRSIKNLAVVVVLLLLLLYTGEQVSIL